MGKVTKKEMPLWAKTGHSKPVTRREFLAAGLIPFAASAFVPGIFGLLAPSRAAAAANCASGGSSLAAFISLNLSGGAGMSGMYAPRTAAGDPLTSYSKLGLGANTGANALGFESEFGAPSWPTFNANSMSQLLVGIRATTTAATRDNTRFLGVCVQSQDDANTNKFDASGLAFKAGVTGTYIPNLGSRASATGTGIDQMAATIKPPAPLVVTRFSDIANSVGYTRSLSSTGNANGLTGDQQNKLAKLVANLSNSQSAKLMQTANTAHVKDLIECAGIKNSGLIGGGANALSPAGNAEILTRWGTTAGNYAGTNSTQNVIFSTMVYNALLGQAGTVNLQLGGYDYHDGTRATGDARDNQAGQLIGRILDTARIMQKKVFLYVTSDGATGSNEAAVPGAGNWVSDRGDGGMAFIFMYDPAGRVEVNGNQIGHFTNGQVADPTTPVGNSPEVAAQSVFANYLKFNNRMDLFDRVIGRAFDANTLNQVIKVG